MSFHVPEQFRVRTGPAASSEKDGNNGHFRVHGMYVIASDGWGWEHVSVSTTSYTPTWSDMCKIKEIFWDPEDLVIQFHPRKSRYVNNHPFCLHMWRPTARQIPEPPPELVGIRGIEVRS